MGWRTASVALLVLSAAVGFIVFRSTRAPAHDSRQVHARPDHALPPDEDHAGQRTAVRVQGSEREESVGDGARAPDPGWDALKRMRIDPDPSPGSVAGIVLQGLEPIEGAAVHLWAGTAGFPSHAKLWREPGTWSATTDAEGMFRFSNLPADAYRSRVDLDGRPRVETRARLEDPGDSEYLVISFGTSALHGTVYDEYGHAASRARVLSSERGVKGGGDGRFVQAWTDDDGRYRIEGLHAGRYWVAAYLPGTSPMEDDAFEIALGSDEVRTVDFGSPHVSSRWQGAVRDGSGELVENGTVWVRDRASGAERRILWRAGRLDAPLPSADYEVFVDLEEHPRLEADPITVRPSGLVQDLILPGTRLEVRIVYEGDDRSPEEVARRIDLRLVSRTSEEAAARSLTWRPGGVLGGFGFEPGRYRLSANGAFRLGPEATVGVDLEIPPGTPVVEYDLMVSSAR